MTWDIVTGIFLLCATGVTLGGVIVKLVKILVRLDTTLNSLINAFGEDKANNANDHEKIFDKIGNHETRIHDLEVCEKGAKSWE